MTDSSMREEGKTQSVYTLRSLPFGGIGHKRRRNEQVTRSSTDISSQRGRRLFFQATLGLVTPLGAGTRPQHPPLPIPPILVLPTTIPSTGAPGSPLLSRLSI